MSTLDTHFQSIYLAQLTEKDIAILKVNNGKGTSVKFGNTPNVEDAVILISSKTGSNVSANIGILVSNDKELTTTIPTLKYEEGAPLFNSKGEVVGMNSSKVTNSSLSKAYSNKYLIELQNKFKNIDEVTYISFEELKNNYFVSYKDDKVVNKIDEDVWNKYKKIGNLEKSINIELVKASYKDNVLSLRYKNTLNKLFSNMQLANNFISELKKDKYKEVINESNKKVYVKDKYDIPKFNKILNGTQRLTADVALKIEEVWGIPAHIYMDLQSQYEIDKEKIAEDEYFCKFTFEMEGDLQYASQFSFNNVNNFNTTDNSYKTAA